MKKYQIKIYENLSDDEIFKMLCNKEKIDYKKIKHWEIAGKSVDARNKSNVHFLYSFNVYFQDDKVDESDNDLIYNKNKKMSERPVVVGAGPAGLFASYVLALNGYNPILLEQGKNVDDRVKDVENFVKTRVLNTKSNVQFGEGGAGTFSDGKLTTNVNSPYNKEVLKTFVKFGAPKEILYLSKPHIGTDNLRIIVKNMRNEIIRLGGSVRFESQVTDFIIENSQIKGIKLQNGETITTNHVILAIGHSARETFKILYDKNLQMEPKPFSIGVRIEHRQEMINKSQYGDKTKLKLPPAEYKLVYHDNQTNKSCYTFCMCPGGEVVASSSEEGTIVTNGMSFFKRDKENANSALLVNIMPEDYMKDKNPLNGMYYQESFERKAFELGGNNYNAPIQKVGDFLNMKNDKDEEEVISTYKPGVTYVDLHELFPKTITDTMEHGLVYFDKVIDGFANSNSIMTGVESRSSSPVRIVRDEEFCSNIKGIYPCGEGAGYAGGIMTASVDGIKVARSLIE